MKQLGLLDQAHEPAIDHRVLRFYFATYRLFGRCYRLFIACHLLLAAAFSGIWLGLLKRETLLEIDSAYYSSTKKYTEFGYNTGGLWGWETAVITRYFHNCKRLLLVGAGGGREVVALRKLGYEIDAFECNAGLVRSANALLQEQGLSPSVQLAPPDTCPTGQVTYDGLIVGWGAYMLIQGCGRRVALLRKMRAHVGAGAPLLCSFFVRSPGARRFFITNTIANTLRGLLRREHIELGDALEPEYVHYFTQEEIAGELRDGGFIVEYYRPQPYGHAVGIAS